MITYEEFLKKNNIENVNSIFFGKEGMVFENVAIRDDPKQYIDVAAKAKDLKYLRIGKFQNKEYFDSMTEFIKICWEYNDQKCKKHLEINWRWKKCM